MKYEIRLQRHSWGSKTGSDYVNEFDTREEAENEIERLERISEEDLETGQCVKSNDYYFIKEI